MHFIPSLLLHCKIKIDTNRACCSQADTQNEFNAVFYSMYNNNTMHGYIRHVRTQLFHITNWLTA